MLFYFLVVVVLISDYDLILHIAFLLLIVLFLMILGYLIIVLKLRFFLLLVFLRLLVVDGLVVLHLRRLVDEVIHLFLALFVVHDLIISSLFYIVILLVFGGVLNGFFTVLCIITLIHLLFMVIWLFNHVITLFLHLLAVLLLWRGGLVVLHAVMHLAKVLFRPINSGLILLIPICVVLLHLVLLILRYKIVQQSFRVVINLILILHWKQLYACTIT